MIEGFLLSVVASLAIKFVCNIGVNLVVSFFRNLFSNEEQVMPDTIRCELSDTDKQMAQQTNELINEHFGEDVCSSIKSMSNIERLQAADKFANELKELYGLDIDIDVVAQEERQCGYYNWQESKAVFNVIELWIDNNDPAFEEHIKNFFDTIIHELRHAVQYKAVSQEGFWNVEQDRRESWKNNFDPNNYIRAEIDLRGYMTQPVENDAYTFAAYVMEGAFAQ